MAFHPESKLTARSILILFLEGLLIGVGAMLPGISGGVLMVIFGFYHASHNCERLSHAYMRGIKMQQAVAQ